MIHHLVIFRFNQSTSENQKEEAINKLNSLKSEIPGIEHLQAGRNFTNRSQGFDIGLLVIFNNKSSLEEYGPHPLHQEVVAYLKEIGLSDLIVVDFES